MSWGMGEGGKVSQFAASVLGIILSSCVARWFITPPCIWSRKNPGRTWGNQNVVGGFVCAGIARSQPHGFPSQEDVQPLHPKGLPVCEAAGDGTAQLATPVLLAGAVTV